MMAKQSPAPAEAPVTDPHEGHGGSYIIDPVTGRRELVERTQERGADAPAEQPE